MKKLLLSFVLFGLAIYSNANTITVYGKNEGSETTTTQTTNSDGSTVTTTTTVINCNSFYQDVCYKIETGSMPGEDKLTFGNDPTPVIEGTLVAHDQANNVVEFIVE